MSVAQVVRVFALTGILSIGGGRAAFFYEALVARRRWMRVDEFLQDFTLAQLLPGATFSNLSITLGHRLAGVAGALGGLGIVADHRGVRADLRLRKHHAELHVVSSSIIGTCPEIIARGE